MTTNTDQERSQFEDWAKNFMGWDITPNDACGYKNAATTNAWFGWCGKARTVEADRQRGSKPVAWFTEDHLTDKSATTWDAKAAQRWREKGWPVNCLYDAPQLTDPVGVPSDEEILTWAGEEEFFLFCDEDEFLQIARAVLARYGSSQPAASPEGSPADRIGFESFDPNDRFYHAADRTWWRREDDGMLIRADAPQPAASAEAEPSSCVEDDGCPKEIAVLQRFWRDHQMRVVAGRPGMCVPQIPETVAVFSAPQFSNPGTLSSKPAASAALPVQLGPREHQSPEKFHMSTGAAPVAQEPVNLEHCRAIKESERNAAENEFFNARPKLNDTPYRVLFCAGFDRGWDAAPVAAQPSVPRRQIESALNVVQDAMHEAYNSGYQECCGHGVGGECCGNPDAAWDETDRKIMDVLAPVQRALSAMFAVAPTPPAVEQPSTQDREDAV